MSIKNLFFWSYWFQQPYIARGWVFWAWLIGFLFFVLAGIIMLLVRHWQSDKLTRIVLQRFSTWALTMGVVGLIWFFFRQERVVFLAWRFWLWLWLAIFAVWAVKLIRYTIRRLPQIRKEHLERAQKERYLAGRV